jgi:hypothetical protein
LDQAILTCKGPTRRQSQRPWLILNVRQEMPISSQISPPMDSRPCHFSLCLQGGSVFADFDVDDDAHVLLRRISFDGFGCCTPPETIRRMAIDHSRTLLEAVARRKIDDPKVELILRAYFRENAGILWSDALSTHELV